MNGMIKVPMQFCILFIGSVLFVFYQFAAPPLFFNQVETDRIYHSPYAGQYQHLETEYRRVFHTKEKDIRELVGAMRAEDEAAIEEATRRVRASQQQAADIRKQATDLMKKNNDLADTNDSNYVFLSFVTRYLPAGLVGLLIAVVFAASMGSTSSALNSLASTTVVDIYKRTIRKDASEKHYLLASKLFTVFWGLYCVGVAQFANRLGNLLEAVNQLGSLFYGSILGIFLVAFYLKSVRGSSTFYAALITEAIVLICYFTTKIAFLWYNVIGCLLVVVIAWLFSGFTSHQKDVLTEKQ
jgi:Na+(H+)/acetate symporter ActP